MLKRKEVWEKTPELAVVLAVSDYIPKVFCKGLYEFSSPMNSGQDSYLISLKEGVPPTFHESMFRYEPPSLMSFGDPISVLSEINFSPNSKYVSKLARSSLAKRKK
jgi:hypothetical protein